MVIERSESGRQLLFLAGVGQLGILIATAIVPFQLNWRKELHSLTRLHRQMHWVYGGYVVMSIVAFAILSILNAPELAGGSGLAAWWLKAGYALLTVMFATFTIIYSWAAVHATG